MPTFQPAHRLGIVFKLAKWKYLSRPVMVGHNPCILKWTMDVGDHICTYRITVTLGCFTNGTIAQVVTNSLSPLSGQHLYDGSGATV